MAQSNRVNFGSKLGVILATAGSAVGLGNIWRFPYMTGHNGGAAFILIYIGCVIFLGIPGMVCEFIIGRHSSSNAARAYLTMGKGTPFSIMGYVGVITSTIILGFYSVVAGWCLQYLMASLLGNLNGDANYIVNYFNTFSTNPIKPAVLAVLFILLTHIIVAHGVDKGIEKASKLMMPALFILLIVIIIASCSLPNAMKGIDFLFNPDFSKVDHSVVLGALGQAFFSLSLGTGCLCTYASYFNKHINLLKSATQIALIDTLVAIFAGLMIFPAAFSIGVSPDSGPSLIFITLPRVFLQAFHAVPMIGYIISVLFYSLLALAALTSTISMHEIGTAFIHEEMHLSRKGAAWIVTIVCCIVAVLCSLSVSSSSGLMICGKSLLDCCDFITAQVLLPLGGFCTCIMVGWYISHKVVRDEFTNWGTLRGKLFHVFVFCAKYVCPILILMIFLNQFGII